MKTENISLLGIALTFIISAANLITLLKNNKKNIFITTVTSSRLKYVQELRNLISEFCAIVESNHLGELQPEEPKYREYLNKSNILKYQIRLYLNPDDDYWDREILNLTEQIKFTENVDHMPNIKRLITISQFLLKSEWEGIKMESEIGILSDFQKKELYNKYIQKHKKYLEKHPN